MAKEKRFERVYKQGGLECCEILVDTETGVQYFFRGSGYAGGMTPLLDAEGKPLLYRKKYNFSPEM